MAACIYTVHITGKYVQVIVNFHKEDDNLNEILKRINKTYPESQGYHVTTQILRANDDKHDCLSADDWRLAK